jgi:hypothetical protein
MCRTVFTSYVKDNNFAKFQASAMEYMMYLLF